MAEAQAGVSRAAAVGALAVAFGAGVALPLLFREGGSNRPHHLSVAEAERKVSRSWSGPPFGLPQHGSHPSVSCKPHGKDAYDCAVRLTDAGSGIVSIYDFRTPAYGIPPR